MDPIQTVLEREIFPTVIKPSRYTGNELNVIQKDFTAVDIKVALAFPDIYELGMSYIGFTILYHLLNRREDTLAERVYTPWVDMDEKIRQRRIPLFSLESKKPLQEFDIIAFTLPYELCYTNILNMLELAHIPLKSEERNRQSPLVIAGGLGAYNPEPLAEFMDAFVVGDGEDVTLEIVNRVKALRDSSRHEMLQALSKLKGVYVPSFYTPEYDDGTFKRLVPIDCSVPTRISSRTVKTLTIDNYPDKPLVPFTEIEHDRLTIEIMRGCPRQCRFCNASVLYHPLRERPMEDILRQAQQGIASTGYDEISLLSLSTTDYPHIEELLANLNDTFARRRVAVALPSLRPDTFSRQLAKSIQTVRKSGLTFAPEAGTDRLRRVIRKHIRDEDLLDAIDIAYENGWNVVKLYFMIGLPTEQQEDIEAIVRLVREIVRVGKQYGRDKRVNVAISPFSPKAHTPFQWAAQEDLQTLEEKSTYLREQLQQPTVKVKWRSPEVSFIESIFARGDRQLSSTLLKAKEIGCRLDGWSDFFSYPLWQRAFEATETDPKKYISQLNPDQSLPWEHIEVGVSKSTLAREWQRSQTGEQDTCSEIPSTRGRVKKREEKERNRIHETTTLQETEGLRYGRSRRIKFKTPLQVARAKVRMKYAKGEKVRFLSHLDLVRVFERALRRAGLPISYSQGYHPHPKIAFGPPLALGMTSEAEYVDMQFDQPYNQHIITALNQALPAGLVILNAKPFFGKTASLSSVINQAEYCISLGHAFDPHQIGEAVSTLLQREAVWIQREVKKVIKEVDIRPHILGVNVEQTPKGVFLRFRLRTTETGHAKPSEVVRQLLSLSPDDVAILPKGRTEQFIEQEGRLMSPLDCV